MEPLRRALRAIKYHVSVKQAFGLLLLFNAYSCHAAIFYTIIMPLFIAHINL